MKDIDIRRHALKNAVLHDGKAVTGAVIPKILGEDPKLKSKMKELMPNVTKIVNEVNKLSIEEQKIELLKLDNHALDKKEEMPKELPELKNVKPGKCSFRLPPGPEKELHIGHAFSYLLNNYYAKKYKGKLILRFEDTNPEKCEQRFVNGNKEDLKMLGITWDEEYYLSDKLPDYYKMAEKMIKNGDAYICNCNEEKISKDRENHVRCSCADKDVNGNLREWNKMKYGTYREGQCVLRLLGNLKSKNSVMWDPTIFRINRTKHYRQGSKYFIWPMYDFCAAVEDARITHVLRDANWTQRVELQDFIRKKLGIKTNPENVLYSRYQLEGGVTQGRTIRKLVEDKIVDGYDDIRLGTVKGLIRRGFLPETFMQLLIEVGLGKSQHTVPLEKMNTINSRLLDKKVDRYFFVEDPVTLKITNAPTFNVELPMSPYDPKRTRKADIKGEVYIQRKDAKPGLILLKYAYNVRIIKVTGDTVIGEYVPEKTYKDIPIIQWVVPNNSVPILVKEALPMFNEKDELNKVNMVEHKGFAEQIVEGLPVGAQVQFERFAFCKKDNEYWNFTHK